MPVAIRRTVACMRVCKAVASAMQLVGEDGVRLRSFVHAHGSSTPANRVTESELLDRVATSCMALATALAMHR